jgi:integrase
MACHPKCAALSSFWTVPRARLEKICGEWEALPRKRRVAKKHADTCKTRIGRFVTFVQSKFPKVKTMADVDPTMARGYMRHEENENITPRTYNSILSLMRSVFTHLAFKADIVHNPFDGIPSKETETVHRKPFSREELENLRAAAAEDDFLRPILVTGMCTAMRLGDCCKLRWDDVDLDERFVTVKTSKTGETTDIPLFVALEDEIRSAHRTKLPYVFPKQAAMYEKNPTGITYRMRKLFKEAGYYNLEKKGEKDEKKANPQAVTHEALPAGKELQAVIKKLRVVPESVMSAEKRDRVVATFETFASGKGVTETARELRISKASVSTYLNDVIEITGLKLKQPRYKTPEPPPHVGDVNADRQVGQKKATIRDFHSFRVTWITLALSAGVPLELVQRVTGHKTADVVLKHYFKPGREDFRKSIEAAMPKMLVSPSGQKSEGSTSPRLRRASGGPRVVAEKPAEYLGQGGDGPSEWLGKALEALKDVSGKANQVRAAEAVEMILKAREWYDSHVVRETA